MDKPGDRSDQWGDKMIDWYNLIHSCDRWGDNRTNQEIGVTNGVIMGQNGQRTKVYQWGDSITKRTYLLPKTLPKTFFS